MKKLAAVGFIGFGSLLNPAIANATEDFFAPIELSAQDRITLIAQADDELSFGDVAEVDPEKRVDGFYFPLSVGGQQFSGFDVEKTINKSDYSGTADFGVGVSGETGLGYKFGDFRTEVLYGYSHMPGEDFSLNGRAKVKEGSSEDSNMQTLTFGLLYDIDTNSRWTPYVGGQLGVGWLSLGKQNYKVGGREFQVKEQTQSAFLYGGKVGMSYRVSRQWDLFVEGGYLRTGSYDFDVKETGDTRTVVNNSELDTRRVIDTVTPRVIENDIVQQGEILTRKEVYDPNAEILVRVPEGGFRWEKCSVDFGPTGNGAPKNCYRNRLVRTPEQFVIVNRETVDVVDQNTLVDVSNTSTTTTIVRRPKVSDMNFGPADGWSVRLGFRWFFNQPKIKEVAVVADPEPEVKPEPTPVRGLW